jgi:hypothetical protein
MKYCPRCGSELVPRANFCSSCGYNLSVVQEDLPEEQESLSSEEPDEPVSIDLSPVNTEVVPDPEPQPQSFSQAVETDIESILQKEVSSLNTAEPHSEENDEEPGREDPGEVEMSVQFHEINEPEEIREPVIHEPLPEPGDTLSLREEVPPVSAPEPVMHELEPENIPEPPKPLVYPRYEAPGPTSYNHKQKREQDFGVPSSVYDSSPQKPSKLIQRVVNLISNPKKEWLVIENEKPEIMKMITGYALILALIPALVTFISYGFIRSDYSVGYALVLALLRFIVPLGILFIATYIADYLAPSFESPKDFSRSFQLVCYAYTPGWVAFVIAFIPILDFLSLFFGFGYMVYLLYTGIPVLKGTAKDKSLGYSILMVISCYVSYIVVYMVLKTILL